MFNYNKKLHGLEQTRIVDDHRDITIMSYESGQSHECHKQSDGTPDFSYITPVGFFEVADLSVYQLPFKLVVN
jgi:hypothetical protein